MKNRFTIYFNTFVYASIGLLSAASILPIEVSAKSKNIANKTIFLVFCMSVALILLQYLDSQDAPSRFIRWLSPKKYAPDKSYKEKGTVGNGSCGSAAPCIEAEAESTLTGERHGEGPPILARMAARADSTSSHGDRTSTSTAPSAVVGSLPSRRLLTRRAALTRRPLTVGTEAAAPHLKMD